VEAGKIEYPDLHGGSGSPFFLPTIRPTGGALPVIGWEDMMLTRQAGLRLALQKAPECL
jgi:hypothetical protein